MWLWRGSWCSSAFEVNCLWNFWHQESKQKKKSQRFYFEFSLLDAFWLAVQNAFSSTCPFSFFPLLVHNEKKILFKVCFVREKEVVKCTSNSTIAGEKERKKYIPFQSELSWKKDSPLEVINIFTLWQKHQGCCILICKSRIFYLFSLKIKAWKKMYHIKWI